MQSLKLKEIRLKDFMNVEAGKISFEEGNHIIGIYGPNCSGKSTVVKALKTAHALFSTAGYGLDTNKDRHLITIGKTKATLSFRFSIGSNELEYTFSIRRNRSNAGVYLSYECVSFNANNGKGSFKQEIRKRTWMDDINTLASGNEELKKTLAKRYEDASGHRSFFKDEDSSLLIKAMACFFKSMIFIDADIEGELRYDTPSPYALRYDDSTYIYSFLDSMLAETGVNLDELDDPETYGDPNLKAYLEASCLDGCLDNGIAVRNAIRALCHKTVKEANDILGKLVPYSEMDFVQEGFEDKLFSVRSGAYLPFDYESYGMKKLFKIALELRYLINRDGYTLVVDELDEGLYEFLLGKILLFVRKNAKGLLIFTSHNLYPLETLDKNSIWFATTDSKHRYTHLKDVRKSDNPRDKYIQAISGTRWNLTGIIDEKRIANAFRFTPKDKVERNE